MEIIAILLATLFVFAPIIGGIAVIGATLSKPRIPAYKQCENRVSNALNNMDMKFYVVFDNLILQSNGNTSHTEIDHVVVSPFGIFCIETKSHKGSIYGSEKSAYWK
ncbi:NERD domain-containing protein [Candidatus Saccharibacteria bacterium]|nr:NERD domain-containing protein [Candidatus Saccharibacteria bacterium]